MGANGQNNRLTEDTTIKGNIVTASSLDIAGVVEGDINAGGEVTVLDDGLVRGDISSSHVRVAGRVEGRITATGRLLITATGSVVGDVDVGSLLIEEGGALQGQCDMGRDARPQPAAAVPPPGSGPAVPVRNGAPVSPPLTPPPLHRT